MKTVATRLNQLEKHFQEQKLTKKIKIVPENWEDFVKLCTIRSGVSMVQFNPYSYQKLLVNLMLNHSNIVVVKSRQLGTTQCIVSKFLHDAALNPASSSVCFMRNGDDVGSLSRRLKQMLQGLQEYVRLANDSVGYIKLENFGDIYVRNSSKEGIRSLDSVQNQLYDESAFIDNIEQIYGASSAASALVGDAVSKIIVSTPSSKMGWYWNQLSSNNNCDIEQICKDVAEGNLWRDIPGFYYFVDAIGTLKVILHWRCHPVYSQIDKEYPGGYLAYRAMQDGTDEEVLLREYDLQFIDSSSAVFESSLVRANAIGNFENSIDENATYFGGLDSSGMGTDYTAFVVLKYKEGKYSLVNLYRRRQETVDFHLFKIGQIIEQYQIEKVGVETNGGGLVYLEQLSRNHKSVKFEEIRTTEDSKTARITLLQLALEKEILSFPQKSALTEELLSFRRSGKKLEASPGRHDDCVLAASFALSVTEFAKQKKRMFNF